MEKMEDYYKEPKKKIDWRYWSREILEVIVCFLIAYVIFLIINFTNYQHSYIANYKKYSLMSYIFKGIIIFIFYPNI